MRYIVTGGFGFIGHNVVGKLISQGHDVLVIDNNTDYGFLNKEELEYLSVERQKVISAALKVNGAGKYEYDTFSINDTSGIEHLFNLFAKDGRIDGVIHLASYPRQKAVNMTPVTAGTTMCPALINLLECSVSHEVGKFVYISSSMVYGDFENDITEESPCNPVGLYGIMKYMGEKIVEDYKRKHDLDYVIIRPSAVYGELDVEDRVVSKFMLGAIRGDVLKVNGAGEVLDFTYVGDVAEGIVQATLSENTNCEVYNLTRSSSQIYTLLDAAELAIKITGMGSIELKDRDMDFPSRGRLDISKAVRDFGYDPKVDVEEGFVRYYTWFKTSPYWMEKLGLA